MGNRGHRGFGGGSKEVSREGSCRLTLSFHDLTLFLSPFPSPGETAASVAGGCQGDARGKSGRVRDGDVLKITTFFIFFVSFLPLRSYFF